MTCHLFLHGKADKKRTYISYVDSKRGKFQLEGSARNTSHFSTLSSCTCTFMSFAMFRFYFFFPLKLEVRFNGELSWFVYSSSEIFLNMEQFRKKVLYEYLGTEYRWRFNKPWNVNMRLRVNQSFLTHVLCSEIEFHWSSFLYHTTTVKLIFHTSLIFFPIGHRIGKARFTISVILRAK